MNVLYPPTRFDDASIREWLASWLSAPAMHELAALCGWVIPWDAPMSVLLDQWVTLSGAWDFRSGAERHRMSWSDAEVDGHVLDDDVVVACAEQLGLVQARPVEGGVMHLVVLGGMVRAYDRRMRFARTLFDQLDPLPDVVVLSGHRPLAEAERDAAEQLGWGRPESEMEVAPVALQAHFGVDGTGEVPEHFSESLDGPTLEGPESQELMLRHVASWRTWSLPAVMRPDGVALDVVVAPSGDPAHRRANTADQLAFWADHADVGPDTRIALVSTTHYCVFQQLAALRTLGRDRGCEVVTTGVDWQPDGPRRGAAYLQEIRSALLEAQRLLAVIGPA